MPIMFHFNILKFELNTFLHPWEYSFKWHLNANSTSIMSYLSLGILSYWDGLYYHLNKIYLRYHKMLCDRNLIYAHPDALCPSNQKCSSFQAFQAHFCPDVRHYHYLHLSAYFKENTISFFFLFLFSTNSLLWRQRSLGSFRQQRRINRKGFL